MQEMLEHRNYVIMFTKYHIIEVLLQKNIDSELR